MYDNNRDDAYRGGHRHHDDRNDDPASRWRRSEERYRREAQGDHRFDDEESGSGRRGRDSTYGQSFRDDDYNWRGSQAGWRDQQRAYGSGREQARERDHMRESHRHPGQSYGGDGDSRWFTGQQNSWAMPSPDARRGSAYGGHSFGVDYRPHGYDADRYADENRRGLWDRASDEVASWFGDEDAARRREADHRGRGPKDYVRSDERIHDDANDRLTEDWRVDASNVTVTVQGGEVTLNGTVDTRQAKRRAEDVVDGISGVKHVQNNLRVQYAQAGEYAGNWALNRTSTSEGGTISQGEAAKDTTKV